MQYYSDYASYKKYISWILRFNVLTYTEEVALAEKIVRDKLPEDKIEMINRNLRFVVYTARKFAGRGVSLLDLVQSGNTGLMRAVEKFDPAYGVRLNTYASYWVEQAIQRELFRNRGSVRLSFSSREFRVRYSKAKSKLETELGREPTIDELAREMKCRVSSVRKNTYSDAIPFSINLPLNDEGRTVEDTIADGAIGVVSQVVYNEDLTRLTSALDCLSNRERALVERRYGLNGHSPQKLFQIAVREKVSKERIRQRLKAIHIKLRRVLEEK